MPEVPPNPSDVPPTATEQGDKETVKERHQNLSSQHHDDHQKSGQDQELRKPKAQDFISKGPVIPDGKDPSFLSSPAY